MEVWMLDYNPMCVFFFTPHAKTARHVWEHKTTSRASPRPRLQLLRLSFFSSIASWQPDPTEENKEVEAKKTSSTQEACERRRAAGGIQVFWSDLVPVVKTRVPPWWLPAKFVTTPTFYFLFENGPITARTLNVSLGLGLKWFDDY